MKITSRLPLSITNVVLVGTLLAGAAVSALTKNWGGTVMLLMLALFGLAGAVYARRPDSRDITRINAIEYRDERDRLLAKQGFAAVGAAALILSVVEFVLATLLGQLVLLAAAQVIVLCIVWAIANARAVNRS
ncbi:hypothetical protein GCM10022381_19600 [Leifsonia kafniensis]|uniref:DUF2178 domain-containing protein n=1 Tax=Leifsonia kafniensis TaxID=475957 RepID=A0ABP7KJR9_9MICO